MTIILAVLFGLIDFLAIRYLSFQIGNLLFWILAVLAGNMIRKQYEKPHLIYSIIVLIGLLLGAVIIEVLPVIMFYYGSSEFASIIFDITIYLEGALYLYNPLLWIKNFSFNYMITLLMIAVGTYLGVKRTL